MDDDVTRAMCVAALPPWLRASPAMAMATSLARVLQRTHAHALSLPTTTPTTRSAPRRSTCQHADAYAGCAHVTYKNNNNNNNNNNDDSSDDERACTTPRHARVARRAGCDGRGGHDAHGVLGYALALASTSLTTVQSYAVQSSRHSNNNNNSNNSSSNIGDDRSDAFAAHSTCTPTRPCCCWRRGSSVDSAAAAAMKATTVMSTPVTLFGASSSPHGAPSPLPTQHARNAFAAGNNNDHNNDNDMYGDDDCSMLSHPRVRQLLSLSRLDLLAITTTTTTTTSRLRVTRARACAIVALLSLALACRRLPPHVTSAYLVVCASRTTALLSRLRHVVFDATVDDVHGFTAAVVAAALLLRCSHSNYAHDDAHDDDNDDACACRASTPWSAVDEALCQCLHDVVSSSSGSSSSIVTVCAHSSVVTGVLAGIAAAAQRTTTASGTRRIALAPALRAQLHRMLDAFAQHATATAMTTTTTPQPPRTTVRAPTTTTQEQQQPLPSSSSSSSLPLLHHLADKRLLVWLLEALVCVRVVDVARLHAWVRAMVCDSDYVVRVLQQADVLHARVVSACLTLLARASEEMPPQQQQQRERTHRNGVAVAVGTDTRRRSTSRSRARHRDACRAASVEHDNNDNNNNNIDAATTRAVAMRLRWDDCEVVLQRVWAALHTVCTTNTATTQDASTSAQHQQQPQSLCAHNVVVVVVALLHAELAWLRCCAPTHAPCRSNAGNALAAAAATTTQTATASLPDELVSALPARLLQHVLRLLLLPSSCLRRVVVRRGAAGDVVASTWPRVACACACDVLATLAAHTTTATTTTTVVRDALYACLSHLAPHDNDNSGDNSDDDATTMAMAAMCVVALCRHQATWRQRAVSTLRDALADDVTPLCSLRNNDNAKKSGDGDDDNAKSGVCALRLALSLDVLDECAFAAHDDSDDSDRACQRRHATCSRSDDSTSSSSSSLSFASPRWSRVRRQGRLLCDVYAEVVRVYGTMAAAATAHVAAQTTTTTTIRSRDAHSRNDKRGVRWPRRASLLVAVPDATTTTTTTRATAAATRRLRAAATALLNHVVRLQRALHALACAAASVVAVDASDTRALWCDARAVTTLLRALARDVVQSALRVAWPASGLLYGCYHERFTHSDVAAATTTTTTADECSSSRSQHATMACGGEACHAPSVADVVWPCLSVLLEPLRVLLQLCSGAPCRSLHALARQASCIAHVLHVDDLTGSSDDGGRAAAVASTSSAAVTARDRDDIVSTLARGGTHVCTCMTHYFHKPSHCVLLSDNDKNDDSGGNDDDNNDNKSTSRDALTSALLSWWLMLTYYGVTEEAVAWSQYATQPVTAPPTATAGASATASSSSNNNTANGARDADGHALPSSNNNNNNGAAAVATTPRARRPPARALVSVRQVRQLRQLAAAAPPLVSLCAADMVQAMADVDVLLSCSDGSRCGYCSGHHLHHHHDDDDKKKKMATRHGDTTASSLSSSCAQLQRRMRHSHLTDALDALTHASANVVDTFADDVDDAAGYVATLATSSPYDDDNDDDDDDDNTHALLGTLCGCGPRATLQQQQQHRRRHRHRKHLRTPWGREDGPMPRHELLLLLAMTHVELLRASAGAVASVALSHYVQLSGDVTSASVRRALAYVTAAACAQFVRTLQHRQLAHVTVARACLVTQLRELVLLVGFATARVRAVARVLLRRLVGSFAATIAVVHTSSNSSSNNSNNNSNSSSAAVTCAAASSLDAVHRVGDVVGVQVLPLLWSLVSLLDVGTPADVTAFCAAILQQHDDDDDDDDDDDEAQQGDNDDGCCGRGVQHHARDNASPSSPSSMLPRRRALPHSRSIAVAVDVASDERRRQWRIVHGLTQWVLRRTRAAAPLLLAHAAMRYVLTLQHVPQAIAAATFARQQQQRQQRQRRQQQVWRRLSSPRRRSRVRVAQHKSSDNDYDDDSGDSDVQPQRDAANAHERTTTTATATSVSVASLTRLSGAQLALHVTPLPVPTAAATAAAARDARAVLTRGEQLRGARASSSATAAMNDSSSSDSSSTRSSSSDDDDDSDGGGGGGNAVMRQLLYQWRHGGGGGGVVGALDVLYGDDAYASVIDVQVALQQSSAAFARVRAARRAARGASLLRVARDVRRRLAAALRPPRRRVVALLCAHAAPDVRPAGDADGGSYNDNNNDVDSDDSDNDDSDGDGDGDDDDEAAASFELLCADAVAVLLLLSSPTTTTTTTAAAAAAAQARLLHTLVYDVVRACDVACLRVAAAAWWRLLVCAGGAHTALATRLLHTLALALRWLRLQRIGLCDAARISQATRVQSGSGGGASSSSEGGVCGVVARTAASAARRRLWRALYGRGGGGGDNDNDDDAAAVAAAATRSGDNKDAHNGSNTRLHDDVDNNNNNSDEQDDDDDAASCGNSSQSPHALLIGFVAQAFVDVQTTSLLPSSSPSSSAAAAPDVMLSQNNVTRLRQLYALACDLVGDAAVVSVKAESFAETMRTALLVGHICARLTHALAAAAAATHVSSGSSSGSHAATGAPAAVFVVPPAAIGRLRQRCYAVLLQWFAQPPLWLYARDVALARREVAVLDALLRWLARERRALQHSAGGFVDYELTTNTTSALAAPQRADATTPTTPLTSLHARAAHAPRPWALCSDSAGEAMCALRLSAVPPPPPRDASSGDGHRATHTTAAAAAAARASASRERLRLLRLLAALRVLVAHERLRLLVWRNPRRTQRLRRDAASVLLRAGLLRPTGDGDDGGGRTTAAKRRAAARALVDTAAQHNAAVAVALVRRFGGGGDVATALRRRVSAHVARRPERFAHVPAAAPLYLTRRVLARGAPRVGAFARCDVVDALRLLDARFAAVRGVAAFAARSLLAQRSDRLAFYVPQLLQQTLAAADNNACDGGGGVAAVLRRLLRDMCHGSAMFSHQLLWCLRASGSDNNNNSDGADIAAVVRASMDVAQRAFCDAEFAYVDAVTALSGELVACAKSRRKATLRARLAGDVDAFARPLARQHVYLPTDPRYRIVAVAADGASALQSAAKCPILVRFVCVRRAYEDMRVTHGNDNNDDDNDDKNKTTTTAVTVQRACIFKMGDDCRQDQLSLQLIAFMQRVLRAAGVRAYLYPYRVVATAPGCGVIECVPHTMSRNEIGLLVEANLAEYFVQTFGHPESMRFRRARDNFVQSTAAYSVVAYILNIKDRHNGNILIDRDGHVVHIDFGFLFDTSPGGDINFESSPFKLTTEMVQLIGRDVGGKVGLAAAGGSAALARALVDEASYVRFKVLVNRCYLAIRAHARELCVLVELMLRSGLPCFKPERTIADLARRLALDDNEADAAAGMRGRIHEARENVRTVLYDLYQRVAEGIQM